MAKHSVTKLSLKQLKAEVTCALCSDGYSEPKVLSCLHIYCKDCIVKLALEDGMSKPFSCPKCACETVLPEVGVAGLKSASFIDRFKCNLTALERTFNAGDLKCEACNSGEIAESFCRQCSLFICTWCVESHKKMAAIFSGHEVISVQDMREGSAEAVIPLGVASPGKCGVHNEELKVYCFQCDSLICRDCTVVDHRDHKFQFCAVAAPEAKKDLARDLKPLVEAGERLSLAVEDVRSTVQMVADQDLIIVKSINIAFDELIKIVEKRREELLEDAGRRARNKTHKLATQEKMLALAQERVKGVVSYAERCILYFTNCEVMGIHSVIQRKIEMEGSRKSLSSTATKPVEKADIGAEADCFAEMEKLLRTRTRIVKLASPHSEMREGMRMVQQDDKVEVILSDSSITEVLQSGGGADVVCLLRSLVDSKSIIKCDVDLLESGECRVCCTPVVRGRHRLTVVVDGHHVTGSPFSMFVTAHPSQLGQPVYVLDDVHGVCSVAFTASSTVVLATDGTRQSLKYYKNGKFLKSVSIEEKPQQGLVELEAIAVDERNFIYATCVNSELILKLSEGGKIVKVADGIQGDQVARGYCGLSVLKEEVVVCLRSREGTIVVYSTDLEYKRKVVVKGAGKLQGICTNPQGTLFVADSDNHCVYSIGLHGDVLHSVQCCMLDENQVKTLLVPSGFCVSRYHVYVGVSSWRTNIHGVFVFTLEGEYVVSYQDIKPWALHMDGDGFIYVCDYEKDAVLML